MPTYEYECGSCGFRFERKQAFLEDPVQVCPRCEGSVRRIIHPVGIVFKADGFYITDNRPRAEKEGEEKKPAEATKSETAASTTTTSSASED